MKRYINSSQADRAAKEAARAEAERQRNERLDQVDISKYKPTPQIIAKIQDYKDRNSRVNTKAIRSLDKLYTYYYASILLGWQRLYWDILDAFSANFEDRVDHDITARISRDARREREQNAKGDQS